MLVNNLHKEDSVAGWKLVRDLVGVTLLHSWRFMSQESLLDIFDAP